MIHGHMDFSLYIHIPFCVRKCLYCDFASCDDSAVPHDEYLCAVIREMESRSSLLPGSVTAKTLYIGGGTPSLLDPELVGRLVAGAQRHYALAADAEVTLEANPGTVTAESLAGYRSGGVNRLSLGVQSLDDAMLERLGRIHTADDARNAISLARSAGFDNIGIDLIHSLPGQTLAHWEQTIRAALSLRPDHISAYGLTIEEETPFGRLQEQGRLELPDSDQSAAMFEMTMDLLTAAGYEQYEIANFALPGRRSRHNQVYWHRGCYLGFGAGAHSFLRIPGFGERWSNPPDIEEYCRPRSTVIPADPIDRLTKREAMGETLFLGLRMREGVDGRLFRDEFGLSIGEAFPGVLDRYSVGGLLEIAGDRISLTRRGILLANQLFAEFA